MIPPHSTQRKPGVFSPDRAEVTVDNPAAAGADIALGEVQPALPARIPNLPRLKRGFAWGGLLMTALGGLVSIAAGLWLQSFIIGLLVRQDWLGWVAVALVFVALVAALVLLGREALGLIRIARLDRLRTDSELAVRDGDKTIAESVVRSLDRLYGEREDIAWGRAQLAEHRGDIMNAGELLRLAERTLVAPLDPPARAIIAASAKRVSVVTAISPIALIDMIFVATENLRMLKRLATLYGARPGFLGLLRLARMVISHIVLTGGIAIGDDMIHQVIGHGLTARLSSRLGEGVFNGALTARIGLATIDVCRPLPYLERPRPRFRDFVAELAGIR